MLLCIIFLLFCTKEDEIINKEMATYYVSTTGNDGNAGTLASPWKSWHYGIARLSAGDILYIRAGTYIEVQGSGGGNVNGVYISGRSGTPASHITVSKYPGDARPVLDCSALSGVAGYHRGFLTSGCNYWDFFGLIIKNVREYSGSPTSYTGSGWEIQGCNNLKIEYCDLTYCMNGWSFSSDTMYNINFINCDSYENWDIYQSGDLCNGFNCNTRTNSTINFTGCRAWKNSDDGFDFLGGSGIITMLNCWAFNNQPWHGGDASGNGCGFKLAQDNTSYGGSRYMYNCITAYNGEVGIEGKVEAGGPFEQYIYNCTVANNGSWAGIRVQANAIYGTSYLRNVISYGAGSSQYDAGAHNVHDHNSFDSAVTATDADFTSVALSQLSAPRQADGSLPVITAFHLVVGSDLRNAGDDTDIYPTDCAGNSWDVPPSMGVFEYGTTPPVTPPADIPVTAVTVVGAGGQTVITVNGGTLQMSAHIDPHNATDQTVVWSVINGTGSASINQAGLLTAITNGTVTVKATSNG